MTMKYIKILFSLSLAVFLCSCQPNEIDFNVETGTYSMPAEGGIKTIQVESSDPWIATTAASWIAISPANGRGSQEIRVIVDTTLDFNSREAIVRIRNLSTSVDKDFEITQDGYRKMITIDEREITVEDYAAYGKRTFDVVVNSNVEFDVEIELAGDTQDEELKTDWLTYKKSPTVLDRGARPRNTLIEFNWDINFRPKERNVVVKFKPVSDDELAVNDQLNVTQKAAQEIEEGAQGDSLALLALSRNLSTWSSWDPSDAMKNWNNVRIWHEDDPGYKEEYKGRVRYARFFLFKTEEGIPYEVKYLTAAEDLQFYSNENNFLKSINLGDYITELTQLKRLTIGAYGLTELPDSFKNLKNLEALDLSSNNFQTFPDVLTKDNFPKLHCLIMNANQRSMVYDLSNTNKKELGGFIDDKTIPKRLFEWDNLDTLRLSYNYFQGELPDMLDCFDKYEQTELGDTIPESMIGKPRVLPKIKMLSINGNRLRGEIPHWLMYHPNLDYLGPYILVFPQEGKDQEGNNAGFSNDPPNMDYYYQYYTSKKNPEYSGEEEEIE